MATNPMATKPKTPTSKPSTSSFSIRTVKQSLKEKRSHDATDRERSLSVQQPSQPPEASPRDVHGLKWVLVVISLCSATFLWGLDGTIVADIQVTFVREFDSIEKLSYNSVAFFLGAAATVLSWGQVLGNFNVKWTFIVCVIIFEAGSAICGAAPNIEALIAGRTICGVGGSGMYVGVLTLLSMSTTEKERAMYMAWPALTWGTGTVLGPIIGGAFAESPATWRWGFYVQLVIGALFAPVYLFLLPSKDARPGVSWRNRITNLDLPGLILMCGATTALILAICFGGLTFPWESGSMIALWAVCGVLFIFFCVQQAYGIGTNQVVFPTGMMKDLRIVIIFINECCSATACFLPIYFIPLYFQYVHDESPLTAGVRLLPLVFLTVGTVFICGAAVTATGRWLPWFYYGGALVLTGGALMYTVNENTSTAMVYGFSVLLGTGTGAYIQMPFNACQTLVDPSLIPAATGLITWGQLAAPAVTLSIANSIFLNVARQDLLAILPPGSPVLAVVSGVGGDYLQDQDSVVQQRAIHAIVQALSQSYVLVFVAGAITLILTVGLSLKMQRLT